MHSEALERTKPQVERPEKNVAAIPSMEPHAMPQLAPLEEAMPTGRNRVSNGHGLFDSDNVDVRSKASRRFRDIAAAIASDLVPGIRAE
jgi:hypothetical protein